MTSARQRRPTLVPSGSPCQLDVAADDGNTSPFHTGLEQLWPVQYFPQECASNLTFDTRLRQGRCIKKDHLWHFSRMTAVRVPRLFKCGSAIKACGFVFVKQGSSM